MQESDEQSQFPAATITKQGGFYETLIAFPGLSVIGHRFASLTYVAGRRYRTRLAGLR